MNGFLKANELFRKYYMWLEPEDKEQGDFVLWLEMNGYKFTSIPNNTYTTSWKQKITNTILGLRPGLPDLLIVLKKNSLLFIEMKIPLIQYQKKNGQLGKPRIQNGASDFQKDWIESLKKCKNVYAEVAYGSKQAKALVEFYEKR